MPKLPDREAAKPEKVTPEPITKPLKPKTPSPTKPAPQPEVGSIPVDIAPMVESEPVSSVSENKPVKDDFDLLAGPVRESPVEVKSDFDLLNGDQFNDSKSVTDLKKDITGT